MLMNIESQKDYDEYKERVESFFKNEGISILSCEYDEPSFSHNSCECCGRPLGGDRYTMKGLTHAKPYGQEIFDYYVCTDCLYYNEYGQLDDMAMLDHDLS
jgi:hypothetical protein